MANALTITAVARRHTFAARKLVEVEARIARAEGMKHLLGQALQCRWLTLDACAHAFRARICSDGDQGC